MHVEETTAPAAVAESAPAVESAAEVERPVEAAPRRLRGVEAWRASQRPAATPRAPAAAVDWSGRSGRRY